MGREYRIEGSKKIVNVGARSKKSVTEKAHGMGWRLTTPNTSPTLHFKKNGLLTPAAPCFPNSEVKVALFFFSPVPSLTALTSNPLECLLMRMDGGERRLEVSTSIFAVKFNGNNGYIVA
nr:hypothetical protein Iba_chr06fCG8680 [Ipomoea batatas]GME00911.1 hypothetical protein Iba_contig572CG0010 [Ipomoea batatas]